MLDDLFKLVFRAASVEPVYDPKLCISARRSFPACTACRDACPHQAITIKRQVEIDEVDCSGCGLCVQACPSQALEARPTYQRGSSAKCSQVAGDAQTVHCLARLQATDLLRLVGRKDELTLARAECAACPVGAAAVAEAVERVRLEALELARVHGREVAIEVVETERFDEPGRSDPLSRRELLRGGWRGLRHGAADLLAPLDPGDDDPALPSEMQRRLNVIEAAAPAEGALVPWSLPRVGEGCIMCPVCTNSCPTGAIVREFDDAKGAASLHLDPTHCMGCSACVEACPVGVMRLDEHVTWGELSGGPTELFRRSADDRPEGTISR